MVGLQRQRRQQMDRSLISDELLWPYLRRSLLLRRHPERHRDASERRRKLRRLQRPSGSHRLGKTHLPAVLGERGAAGSENVFEGND